MGWDSSSVSSEERSIRPRFSRCSAPGPAYCSHECPADHLFGCACVGEEGARESCSEYGAPRVYATGYLARFQREKAGRQSRSVCCKCAAVCVVRPPRAWWTLRPARYGVSDGEPHHSVPAYAQLLPTLWCLPSSRFAWGRRGCRVRFQQGRV